MNSKTAPRRGLKFSLLAVFVVAAAFAGYWSQSHLSGSALPPAPEAPKRSQPAQETAAAALDPTTGQHAVPEVLPEFSLKDRQGTPRTLAQWKGHPLVVNFWATWCGPCRREIPLLNRLRAERRSQGFEVVGIAVDFREDVLAYVKDRPIDYPLLIGEEDGLEALKAVGMSPAFPFTLFADSRQRIVALKVGELHQDEVDLILDGVHGVDTGQLDLAAARHQISEGLKGLATKRALKPVEGQTTTG